MAVIRRGDAHDDEGCLLITPDAIGISDDDGAPMSTDDMCNELFRMSGKNPDRCATLLMRHLGTVADEADRRMRLGRWSGRRVSQSQERQYESELDTWLSHSVKMLKLCRAIQEDDIDFVAYIVQLCLSSDWDYAVEGMTGALAALYGSDAWHEHVRDFFEQEIQEGLADGAQEREITVSSQYGRIDAFDLLDLYAAVLEGAGAGADLGRICKEHWMGDARMCVRYMRYLLQSGDRPAAGRIASVGLELFSKSAEIAAAAADAFDPEDERMLGAWCAMYAADPLSGRHYYKMAQESAHWDVWWARRLADMLAAAGSYGEEILVRADAGMHAEALDVLRHDGTLRDAISHRSILAGSHPDEYYEACRALVAGAPKKGADKTHYAMMRQCLRIMQSIPGHESDFEDLCNGLLRNTGSVAAPLRKSVREVMEGP